MLWFPSAKSCDQIDIFPKKFLILARFVEMKNCWFDFSIEIVHFNVQSCHE